MLSKKEFDLLVLLAETAKKLSQRKLADRLDWSLGTVNRLMKSLTEQGYWDGAAVTAQGYEALEPYRVRRAVFLAAGFGSRLSPITLNTPKPLVRVNGVRIIDTMLDAIVKAGIDEIVIVRGYLGEQFDQLRCKYPNIQFVENPHFNESNNISSAMFVRALLRNAYVLDADLILKNPGLIHKYEYESYMLGIAAERTDDWCVTADKDGYISSVAVGGLNAYREVGFFYWTREDGARLEEDIQEVYQAPGGKERFWEQTALIYKKDHYRVALHACTDDDVTEVDTLAELRELDPSYKI